MRALVPALVLCLTPLVSGCVAVAAAGVVGVGVVQYQRNEAEQDFPTDLEKTWQASLEALRRLGVSEPAAALAATEGTIEYDDVVVRVERHPEGFTRVRVRVGTFYTGDHERRAELVIQEISSTLDQEDDLRDWTERVKRPPPPRRAGSSS